MKNYKLISFILIILLITGAIFVNFSGIEKSFKSLEESISLLKETQASITVNPENNASLTDFLELRNKMSLVSFDKDDLSVFQKFFPIILEKEYGLSNVALTITKQYSSLNDKKIFGCNIKFNGDYTQFLKAVNDNLPLIFIKNYSINGDVSSADIYGYVTDLSGNFVYDGTVKVYSIFEQIGIGNIGEGKVFEGAIVYVKDGTTYFLRRIPEVGTYLTCSNTVKFLQTANSSKTFLVLPVKDDLSIQG